MNRKISVALISIVFIAFLIGAFFFLRNKDNVEVIGWVKYTSPSARTITIEKENYQEFTLALDNHSLLFDEKGSRADLKLFTAGTKIEAEGSTRTLKEASLIPTEVRIIIPVD